MNLVLSLPELCEVGPKRICCSCVLDPVHPVYLMLLISPHFPYL